MSNSRQYLKNDKSRCINADTTAFDMVRRGGLEPPRDYSR